MNNIKMLKNLFELLYPSILGIVIYKITNRIAPYLSPNPFPKKINMNKK